MSADTTMVASTRPTLLSRVAGRREVSLFAVLVLIVIIFSLLTPRFFTLGNIGQVLNSMGITVIVGIGMAMVLMTRNIDVSVGSMVGLTAYFAADIAAKNPDLPLIVVILGSCLFGLVLGAINGVLVATLNVPSIMVTLGTLYIYRGIDSMLAGANQVTSNLMPPGYTDIASATPLGIPVLVVYAGMIALSAHIFTRHTYSGRSLLAIGSAPLAAEKLGIPTRRWVFFVFAIAGLLCGFAGVLWGARYGTVDSSVATGYELTVLAAVVVGGVSVSGGNGSIVGLLIGAAILSVISNGLALVNVSPFWLQAIQGAVIVLAIVVDALIRTRGEARGVRS